MSSPLLTDQQPSLELIGLSKSFGKTEVLRGVNLGVNEGEFVSLLGPSGCGKTTTLNIIAGFLDPDSGEIKIDGVRKNHIPPHKRNLAMVFQNYSLFPHMTIFENVAFGLRMRGDPPDVIQKRVPEMLELIHLSDMGGRFPRQLSGGQQQRVGLARALAVHPRILLLDEPLSNLDAKLRKAMQTELRAIQQMVHTTTIYVTHDQEEAFSLSDRIALMNNGMIEQIGSPEEIYTHPQKEFVAEFIGVSNFFTARVLETKNGGAIIKIGTTEITVESAVPLVPGQEVRLAVRPDRVILEPRRENENRFPGNIISRSFVGSFVRFGVDLGEDRVLNANIRTDQAGPLKIGSLVSVTVDPADWFIFSPSKNIQ